MRSVAEREGAGFPASAEYSGILNICSRHFVDNFRASHFDFVVHSLASTSSELPTKKHHRERECEAYDKPSDKTKFHVLAHVFYSFHHFIESGHLCVVLRRLVNCYFGLEDMV